MMRCAVLCAAASASSLVGHVFMSVLQTLAESRERTVAEGAPKVLCLDKCTQGGLSGRVMSCRGPDNGPGPTWEDYFCIMSSMS